MPAKGKYLLNDQELKNEALYRKFSCISQYQPLVLLLGLSMLACLTLLIVFFALRLVSLHFHAGGVEANGHVDVLMFILPDWKDGVPEFMPRWKCIYLPAKHSVDFNGWEKVSAFSLPCF